jgi:hypothetical protein
MYTVHHVLIILPYNWEKKFICAHSKGQVPNKLSSFEDEIHEHTHRTSQLYIHSKHSIKNTQKSLEP